MWVVMLAGYTAMNEASSRSHAVFTVVLTAAGKAGAGGRPERRPVSKLHLVDLAGSERNKKSEAAGARFKVRVLEPGPKAGI